MGQCEGFTPICYACGATLALYNLASAFRLRTIAMTRSFENRLSLPVPSSLLVIWTCVALG
jgi:hypothetical protein